MSTPGLAVWQATYSLATAVSQRRDQADVCVAIHGGESVRGHRAVHVSDGCPGRRAESAVDSADEFVQLTFEVFVFGDLRSAGDGKLHQHDFLAMLGIAIEQALEGGESLGDALGVVESVDAQDDAFGPRGGRRRFVGTGLEQLEVDSERVHADLHGPVAVLNEHRPPVDALAEKKLDAVHEVPGIAVNVEADEIAREHAAQNLAAPGQQAKEVVRREWNVQEERDPRVAHLRADVSRGPHQVVVVHPDQRLVAAVLEGRVGEARVHPLVGIPLVAVELCQFWKRVEQRPERSVREAVIVTLDVRLAQRHVADLIRHVHPRQLLFGLQIGGRRGAGAPVPAPRRGRRRTA
jgi:hypothetical protein